MKKVLIVTNKLVIGGIEKSLIELLRNLVDHCDITLTVNTIGGELFDDIPKSVKVKEMSQMTMNQYHKIFFKNNIYNKLKLRIIKNYAKQCEITTQMYEKDDALYDLAIAYSTPVSISNYYVIHNTIAKNKVLFIHNDVEQIDVNPMICCDLYSRFDKIFTVSQLASDHFCKMFPHLKNKTDIFYNLINLNEILQLSKEDLKWENPNATHICTIGRLEFEKGQDIIPYIVKHIVDKGIDIKWHIIGDGALKKEILDIIKVLHIEKYIVFEGFQKNPYKYLNRCDIYVQTSRQEGFGITLLEAKILNKPIVTSNFPVAYEHIDDKIEGLIVDFNSESFGEAIISLIEDKAMFEFIKNNLRNVEISNSSNKILDIIKEE